MMLGIAARSSIAVPNGRRSQTGDSSVRNRAIPKLTGMPIRSAMKEVTRVPTMGTSAPNCSVTGFQWGLVTNPGPNARSAGRLPATSETMIPASRIRTRNAKNRVASRNSRSSRCCFLRFASGMVLDTGEIPESLRDRPSIVSATLLILAAPDSPRRLPNAFPARVFDLVLPRRLDQRYHVVGHGDVVELEGHRVAVPVGPLEEFEDLFGFCRVGLQFVHQDEGRAGDGPAVSARLIGEDLVEARGILPIGADGRGLEALVVGRHEIPVLVLQQRVGHLVLLGVGVFHVADRPLDPLHERGDALVASFVQRIKGAVGY